MRARFLAVIPARGGSTRLPGKNLATIAGRSLVALALDVALELGDEVEEIVVSSDSGDVLREARRASRGSKRVTMHERPAELSGSEARLEPLLQLLIADREWVTHVILLNPTSPLRNEATVGRCMGAITNLGATDASTVYRSVEHHYEVVQHEGGWLPPFSGPRPRSQDLEPALIEHGACIISSRESIEAGIFAGVGYRPVVTEREESIDIDTEADLCMARGLIPMVAHEKAHITALHSPRWCELCRSRFQPAEAQPCVDCTISVPSHYEEEV